MSNRSGRGRGHDTGGNQRWAKIRLALVAFIFVVALTVLLIVPLLPTGQVTLEVGDVARNDIRAPRRLEYISQIETDQERERAAAAVNDIFDPPETRVARQQISRAQEILAFLNSVRQDTYATPEQQIAWVQAIPDIDLHQTLSREKIQHILRMSDSEWDRVREEVVQVLEESMSTSIREDELAQARVDVSILADMRMTDEEVATVSALVRGLLVPNTFVNTERTEEAQQQARDEIDLVSRTFEAGEIVLREGDTVTELDLEALQALGLLQNEVDWRQIGGALALVLLTTTILGMALYRYQPQPLLMRTRHVALVAFLFILFVAIAKFMVPGRTVLPYLYPAAALSMLVAVLLNPELAVFATLLLAGLVGNITANSLELAAYAATGGLVSVLMLRRVERVNAFFRAGIYVGLTNVVTILVFRLPSGTTDSIGMLTLIVVGLVNGAVAASLTLAIFFVVGNLLDITTALKLLELSQPSHPLLRELLLKAPGTYHHTLLVTSLAEQAAESIGANALLTRVGAFYHDVGKISRPRFFTENQMDGVNPHDQLDPYTSAAILLDHVQAGIELAKRYQLPSRVRAFIPEHQGDSSVSFMYQRAVQLAGGDATQVDASRFRYVGPKPQSRETALVMLADITESMVRSKQPGSVEALEELVNRAIKIRMEQGQLDECDLTLRDLRIIGRSFTDTLKGLYHTRVEYPESAPVHSSVPKELVPPGKLPGATMAMEERAAPDVPKSGSAFAEAFPPSKPASRAQNLPREQQQSS